MKQNGFTAIEVAIICAVIFTIAAIGYATFSDEPDAADRAASLAKVQELASAVIIYKSQTGAYPTNLQALTVASGIYTPVITSLPASDPFGTANAGINGSAGGVTPYAYAFNENSFAVWSFGKDRNNNSGGSGSSPPAAFNGDDVGKLSK